MRISLLSTFFIDSEMLSEGFADRQSVEVSFVFLQFLYGCLLRAYKMCFLLKPNERKDYVRLLSQKALDRQLVASCYERARVKMDQVEAERQRIIEEQFVRYLLLDFTLFEREVPAVQIEASLMEELSQKMEKELASFETELVHSKEGMEVFQVRRNNISK